MSASVYTATYAGLGLSNGQDRGVLSVPAGQMTCFQIPFLDEGFLDSLTVYQVSGTAVAFSVELLTSQVPYPPGNYTSGASPVAPLEPFRVQMPPTGPLTALSGATLNLSTDEIGMSFRNLDGTINSGQRYLYLLINPTSAGGVTTWAVFLRARREAKR